MEFRTPVDLPPRRVPLRHGDRCLLLGSCFAEHIGRRMAESGFRVDVNPFGVLYNPESIRQSLLALLDGLPTDIYFAHDGLWSSWLHSGDFSAATREACARRVAARYAPARDLLPRLDRLYVTFGTNRAYRLSAPGGDGRVVANCHKMPRATFVEEAATPEAIVAAWSSLLPRLFDASASLQVVFTVSPYRYAKYGLHGSQLSKSALLLAVDALCRRFEGRCHYFPAYELVVDELRDYRFYDADMLHPSPQAVAYVWERFAEWSFDEATHGVLREWEPLLRALRHRPLHPDTAAHSTFLGKIAQRAAGFMEKYPNFAVSDELRRLMDGAGRQHDPDM